MNKPKHRMPKCEGCAKSSHPTEWRPIRLASFRFLSDPGLGVPAPGTILALFLFLVTGAGCRRDMFQQPSSKPLERNDFFHDNHMGSRPLTPFTVARGQLNEDE